MFNNNLKVFLEELYELWVNTHYRECKEQCVNFLNNIKPAEESNKSIIYGKSTVFRYLGNFDFIEGNYSKALDNYLQSLELSKIINDKELIASVTNNIGNIYENLSDYEKALYFFEESKRIREEIKDFKNLFIPYNNISNAYSNLAVYKKNITEEEKKNFYNIAFIYLLMSLKLIKDHDIPEKLTTSTHNNVASFLLEIKEIDKALEEYYIAYEICIKYNNKKSLMHSLMGIADCFHAKKDLELAIKYYNEAIDVAKICNAKDKSKQIYKALAIIYKELKDYEKALDCQLHFSDLQSEIFTEDFKHKLSDIEAKFEIEKKEKELEIFKLRNVELVNAYDKINTQKSELEKLNTNLNDFLGIVVHDLKNPISCIISLCDLSEYSFQKQIQDISQHSQNIELIRSQAEKMYKMVCELLDISAIESGRIKIVLQNCTFEHIFKEREFYYKTLAEKKEINFKIHKENIEKELLIDKDRIVEVLDNLITNAIKFTKPGGCVDISFNFKNNYLTCNIKDTGQGFKDTELNNVFKEFKKFSSKPTSGESSTGFGLMIVKKIIDLHKGDVFVTSEKNKGSIFSFKIPVFAQIKEP